MGRLSALQRLCVALLLCVALWGSACTQDPYLLLPVADGGTSTDARRDVLLDADLGQQFDDRGIFFPDAPADGNSDGLADDGGTDACVVRPEICNNADDNCDGQADEGFDKLTSTLYCNGCRGCQWLVDKNAIPACEAGACVVGGCVGGYVDKNEEVDDGCEYACVNTGAEICDGRDNDCDGAIDNDVTFSGSNPCPQRGACAGATPVCRGKSGWVCDYGDTVELMACSETNPCGFNVECANGRCPGILVAEELRCDDVDGDCDGDIDDPWLDQNRPASLGKECNPDPTKQGICAPQGHYVCAEDNDGLRCTQTQAGASPQDERCNGIDDDCDGKVDEEADDPGGKGVVDAMTHVDWTVGGTTYDFYIYRYEAARPDATSDGAGVLAARACSKAHVRPWSAATQAQAATACAGAGKRLCTNEEWEVACRGPARTTYPYGATFVERQCNDVYRDEDQTLGTGSLANCQVSGQSIFDMSGNLREWTSDSVASTSDVPPKRIFVVRGGAYHTPPEGLSCTFLLSQAVEDVALPAVGFRCCSDEAP